MPVRACTTTSFAAAPAPKAAKPKAEAKPAAAKPAAKPKAEAAKAAPNALLGDLARLKSAFALMDTASYKDIEARLTPLAGEKSPYRVYAKEALAFAKLRNGDLVGARADFVVLANSLDNSSDDVRQRAQAARDMIDSGSAKDLPAVVKAALALPTPAAPPAGPQAATPAPATAQ